VYCYQNHRKETAITINRLKDIVTRGFEENPDNEEIEFDFIGGEPLLQFDMIKEICEWTWQQHFCKPYIFFATTNGTLLNEDSKLWFEENRKKIWLGLSIDGTREMHNKNRCNSFDHIDLPFFLRNWPEQPLKMTVSPLTIGSMAEGIIYLHQLGFQLSANLAYGVDWSDNKYEDILGRELEKLSRFYLDNPQYEPIMILNLALHKLIIRSIEKFCGAGTNMEAYDLQGNKYPCHMFYPITQEDKSKWSQLDFTKLHLDMYDQCYTKQYFPMCPTCLGMNINETNGKCDPSICRLMQVYFKANAWFQAQLISQGRHPLKNKEQLRNIITGIRLITLNEPV
jgi:hypothetical protein